MKSEITTTHALQDYIRLCQTNAMFNGLDSNDISYAKFLNEGYFIVGYDLTVIKILIFKLCYILILLKKNFYLY